MAPATPKAADQLAYETGGFTGLDAVMPANPTAESLKAMQNAWERHGIWGENTGTISESFAQVIYTALYAHLAKWGRTASPSQAPSDVFLDRGIFLSARNYERLYATTGEPLLPCPFCGDSALLQGLGEHNVICTNCNVLTPDFATAAEAIAAWNCRQAQSPVDLQQRLDRIEARQIVLYSKLAGRSSPLTDDAKRFIVAEWDAASAPDRRPT